MYEGIHRREEGYVASVLIRFPEHLWVVNGVTLEPEFVSKCNRFPPLQSSVVVSRKVDCDRRLMWNQWEQQTRAGDGVHS